MSNKEAFELIGERAGELAKNQEVQHKMLQIAKKKRVRKMPKNGFIG